MTPCSGPRGKQRPGSILQVAKGPVLFDSQKLHKVMPWSHGQQSVIVAFTPARLDQLHPRQKQVMRDSGFRLREERCFPTRARPW